MRGNALFGGRKQMGGLEPLVQRNFAVLENRIDRDAKLLATLVAPQKALASRLAFDPMDAIGLHVAAVRAHGTVRPNDAFNPLVGRFFVVEMGLGQDAHDGYLTS